MKVFDKYLPFYESSIHTNQMVVGVDTSRILFILNSVQREYIEALIKMEKLEFEIFVKNNYVDAPNILQVSRIIPNNIYLIEGDWFYQALIYAAIRRVELDSLPESLYQLMKISKGSKILVDASVVVYDYDTIVSEIQVTESEGGVNLRAFYKGTGGIEYQDIVTKKYIQEATLGIESKEINLETFNRKVDNTIIIRKKKIFDFDIDKALQQTKGQPTKLNQTTSPIETILSTMIAGSGKGKKSVPCLCGLSGVAKSSIVRSVADKEGLRFVDFRAAFLHRLDMEGLFYMIDKKDNILNYDSTEVADKFTKNAYLGDFVKCSDQYIDYAKQMAERLQLIYDAKEDSEFYDEKQVLVEAKILDKIPSIIEKYMEESKPALLFFDEIIRAKAKILNLFTILLDTKKLGDLTFYSSKIVAAANTPHGMSNTEDGIDLFVGQEVTDPAVLNRLSLIPVTPQNMYTSWLSFIKNAGYDDIIVNFVSQDQIYAYDTEFLNTNSIDVEVKRQTTYPTFRAWELMDRVFKNYRKNKVLLTSQVRGLLGETRVVGIFEDFLAKNNIAYTDNIEGSIDPMLDMIDANIESGVATGLSSPTGFGKTTRVDNVCKAKGYELHVEQMSQKSPSDIMGAPSMISLDAFILGDLFKDSGLDEVSILPVISKEILSDVGNLPTRVTMRAPNKDLNDKIKRVRERRANGEDCKLVIFFDEVNRIAPGSESVQSAVFEAISDFRYAGVKFNPDEISVVLAANIDYAELEEAKPDEVDQDLQRVFGEKPSYGATKPIDSALRLRCSFMDKKIVDETDAASTLEYILDEKNKFHPAVKKYFKNLKLLEILKLMRSAEYKSTMTNVPAVRNFSTLSSAMYDNPEIFSGAWFFPSSADIFEAQNMLMAGDLNSAFNFAIKALNQPHAIANWIALKSRMQMTISIPGVTSPTEVLNAVQEVLKYKGDSNSPESVIKFSNLLVRGILSIEMEIRDNFKGIISAYINDEDGKLNVTDSFMDEQNKFASGIVEIEIEAVMDRDTASKWVSLQYKNELNPDKLVFDLIVPGLNYLQSVNRIDCMAFVLLEFISQGDSTVVAVSVPSIVNSVDGFEKNDTLFAKYNKEFKDVIKTSPVKSFGKKYDVLVAKMK